MVLRWFSSQRLALYTYFVQCTVHGHYSMWVTPFGYLRITECLLLPVAFRSLPRPSSPSGPKASTVNSSSLDHMFPWFLEPESHMNHIYSRASLHNHTYTTQSFLIMLLPDSSFAKYVKKQCNISSLFLEAKGFALHSAPSWCFVSGRLRSLTRTSCTLFASARSLGFESLRRDSRWPPANLFGG